MNEAYVPASYFYVGECYVYLCTYWVTAQEASKGEEGGDNEKEPEETQIQVQVYQSSRATEGAG